MIPTDELIYFSEGLVNHQPIINCYKQQKKMGRIRGIIAIKLGTTWIPKSCFGGPSYHAVVIDDPDKGIETTTMTTRSRPP